MSKKHMQLIGFTYDSPKAQLRSPEGAFVVDTSSGSEITSRSTSIVSIEEFKVMVSEGSVKDLRLKDGELVLKAMRKSMRSAGNQNALDAMSGLGAVGTELAAVGGIMSAGAAASSASAATAAAARTSLEVDKAAHQAAANAYRAANEAQHAALLAESEAFGALKAGGMSAKEAYHAAETAASVAQANAAAEAAAATATEVDAAVNAARSAAQAEASVAEAAAASSAGSILLPAVVVATIAAGGYFATKAITGAASAHKVYEFVPVRMVRSHLDKSLKSGKHIAACVAGFDRTISGLTLTLFLYGSNVKDFVLKIMQDFPELSGNVSVPTGNFTSITVPYSILAKPEFYEEYHLMFNTMNFYDEEVSKNICKQTKFSAAQINKIAAFLDDVTEKSLAAEETDVTNSGGTSITKEEAKQSGLSNIQAYCKKYDITEEQFRETEVARLCAILGCEESGLEDRIGQLVFE